MIDDPYSILGLKKGATRDKVRAAFRRLSKQHHPDVGGDPRQFSALKGAHDLLVDEDRRKHWDKFGWDCGNEEQLRGAAMGALVGSLQAVLSGDEEPRLIDVVARMRAMIEQFIRKQHEAVGQHAKVLERAKSLRGRFKKKGSALAPLVEGQVAQLTAAIQSIERSILVNNEALRILKDETFDAEKMQRISMSQYANNTTSSLYSMGFR